MYRKLAAVIVLAVLAAVTYAEDAKQPSAPVLVETDPVLTGAPPFRRLFLDPMVVEESGGLERVFHAARKYEGNPLLTEYGLEVGGPILSGGIVRDGGKLLMYYYNHPDKGAMYNFMAESTDGIHWTRPKLGVVEVKGSKDNNVIQHMGCPFKLSEPTADRKWIAYTMGSHGARMGYSADGLRWTWDKDAPSLFDSGDVVNYFYDPYKHRMAATWKTSNRQHRAVGMVWSADGLKWVKPINSAIFGADGLDPDGTQIYGMPVFAYQSIFIGLPWIYHARWIKYGRYTTPQVMYEAQEGSPRTMDAQLAWSWDLINWTRTPKREPFIGLGPAGSFDCGMLLPSRGPLVMGDELWFYYTGCDKIHDTVTGAKKAIGLAKLRLDGFCSMHAGRKTGWLISRREVFNTPKVTINAACGRGGYVTAELFDRNNNPIPGFGTKQCNAFRGDSARGELTWSTKTFPPELIDKDKKIKFYIKNADLYSYLPVDINQQIDDGWPD